jgi:hypothetical protein
VERVRPVDVVTLPSGACGHGGSWVHSAWLYPLCVPVQYLVRCCGRPGPLDGSVTRRVCAGASVCMGPEAVSPR